MFRDDDPPTNNVSVAAISGAILLGATAGWNLANIGPVAASFAAVYGVGLWEVGLMTTVLVVSHAAVQVPAGKLIDKHGARSVGTWAAVIVAALNLLVLVEPDFLLTMVLRAGIGVGTGAAFVAGLDYARRMGGSAALQGLSGGVGLASAGLAVLVIPLLAGSLGWRASFVTSAILAGGAAMALLVGPATRGTGIARESQPRTSVLRDRDVYRLGVVHAATFGTSVVLANWIVVFLTRDIHASERVAGAVGALLLTTSAISRPAGGLFGIPSRRGRQVVRLSLLVGPIGILLLIASPPNLRVAAVACILVGIAAGIPFVYVFATAARIRPDASGAAIGLTNMCGSGLILALTPLVGLTFGLPGEGRIGLALLAALWGSALLMRLPTGDPGLGART